MEIYDASSAVGQARVVTLDPAEEFAVSAPGVDEPMAVRTVTVFGGDQPYFTVAGCPFGEEGPEAYAELDHRFTDSGVLPPHVREVVQDLVPVVDTPSRARGFRADRVSLWPRDPRVGGYTDEHDYAVEPQTSLLQSQRRAQAQRLEEQSGLARAAAPSVAMDAVVVPFPVGAVSPYRGRV